MRQLSFALGRSAPAAMLIPLLLVCGCVSVSSRTSVTPPARAADDRLLATAWVQTSGEWAGLCEQAYAAAGDAVRHRVVSTRDPAGLPPAVILDVDETVLDNTPYQVRIIRDGVSYSSETWAAWVNEAACEPVPGVAGFIALLRELGVTPIYVTNRRAQLEAATIANLRATVDPEVTADRVHCRGEQGWTGDKTARRAHVASRYSVIAHIGDDLGDFLATEGMSMEARRATAIGSAERWGREWFCIPNPMYGGWERAFGAAAQHTGGDLRARIGVLDARSGTAHSSDSADRATPDGA